MCQTAEVRLERMNLPKVGPAYAATEYKAEAIPRFDGSQKSAYEAETSAIGAAPKQPARNLDIKTPAREGLNAVGICINANRKYPPKSGIRRPTSSLIGPQSKGPKEKPPTNRETPSSITVSLVSNS